MSEKLINVEQLKEQYTLLENKLKEIYDLPRLTISSAKFSHLEFKEDKIVIVCLEDLYTSSCFKLELPWSQINQPIDYFREKFQKEIDANKEWYAEHSDYMSKVVQSLKPLEASFNTNKKPYASY